MDERQLIAYALLVALIGALAFIVNRAIRSSDRAKMKRYIREKQLHNGG